MQIFELLREDHTAVAKEFDRLEKEIASDDKNAKKTFIKIKDALEEHTLAEERLFYPLMDDQPDVGDLMERARAQHEGIRSMLIMMLPMFDRDLSMLVGAASELRNRFSEHVFLEESEIFEKADDMFVADDLERIGNEVLKAERVEHPIKSRIGRVSDSLI